MKIAAVQFTPERTEVGRNLASIRGYLQGMEADLVIFPELSTTGYFFTDREELRALSEPAGEGPLGELVRSVASEQSMTVIAGFSEIGEAGKLYNSAIVALPDGSFSIYRKLHLFYREPEVFQPGDTPPLVVATPLGNVGVMICYDWRFPEVARTLRLHGAQVIAHPSNLVAGRELWVPTNSVRAFENRVFIATANRGGEENIGAEHLRFSGGSAIFDVNGSILAQADMNDGVVLAEVDPARPLQTSFNGINDILSDRRPEMYDL